MKKFLTRLGIISVFALFSIFMLSCTDNENNSETEQNGKYGSLYTEAEFNKCYSDNPQKKEITFLLDVEKWGGVVTSNSSNNYHVRGSFNTWKDDNAYKLTLDSSNKFYSLTVSYDKVATLGNSGHPEYKFNINGTDDGYLVAKDKSFIPAPYCFHTSDYNLILIFEGEDIEDIKKCSEQAGTLRTKLSDWDFSKEEEKEKFANFRKVPGTTNVYRSWHPFKTKYKKNAENKKFLYETEPKRAKMVQEMYKNYDIKSDICLSNDETTSLSSYPIEGGTTTYTESVPDFYKNMVAAGDVCNVTYKKADGTAIGPEYKYIYQADYNEEYLNGWLQNIIDFVKENHPAPYNIHCRLGNDRTGYYCAVVAGLCGATWEQIANDYQSSNNTFLGEYRDQRLLKQVFEKQFTGGEDISKITNLKDTMYKYYTTNSKKRITKEDLDALVKKFTAN